MFRSIPEIGVPLVLRTLFLLGLIGVLLFTLDSQLAAETFSNMKGAGHVR